MGIILQRRRYAPAPTRGEIIEILNEKSALTDRDGTSASRLPPYLYYILHNIHKRRGIHNYEGLDYYRHYR